MREYVHIYFSIIAGIIYLIIAIISQHDPLDVLYILVAILIIANLLGRILRRVLRNNIPAELPQQESMLEGLLDDIDLEAEGPAADTETEEKKPDEFDLYDF